jgi:MarR family transcriptional regulator, 2-MHQ and catechol-resistance regulon repressor
MPEKSTTQATKASFLPAMRELVRAYQAFSAYSETHVRQFDLMPAQFDVIATLGRPIVQSLSRVCATLTIIIRLERTPSH